jgi:hypothetical protein
MMDRRLNKPKPVTIWKSKELSGVSYTGKQALGDLFVCDA